jgi:hypothetical protein
MERAKVDPKFRRRLVARLRGKNIHKLIERAENQGALHEFALHDALRTLSKIESPDQEVNAQFLMDSIKSHLPDLVRQVRILKHFGAK